MCLFSKCGQYERNYEQVRDACFSLILANVSHLLQYLAEGGFPVMAEITRILAANILTQFFFVITTTVSTCCLVQNFQLFAIHSE